MSSIINVIRSRRTKQNAISAAHIFDADSWLKLPQPAAGLYNKHQMFIQSVYPSMSYRLFKFTSGQETNSLEYKEGASSLPYDSYKPTF